MEYRFRDIEKKWQEWWNENKVYKVSNDSAKAKVLCAGYVSVSEWGRFACGASVGLYRIGYLCTVQTTERF